MKHLLVRIFLVLIGKGKSGDDFDKEKIFKPDYEFDNQLELEEVLPNGGNVRSLISLFIT